MTDAPGVSLPRRRKHRQPPLDRCERVALAFQASQEELWSSMWPLGHCAVTSLLLCPLLRCADEPGGWRVAAGVVVGPRWGSYSDSYGPVRVRDDIPRAHAWCESAAGDVVDATYGQFDRGDSLVVLPAQDAGELGHYSSWIMTLDEEERARRSIVPSYRDGWTAQSSVKAFFKTLEYGR